MVVTYFPIEVDKNSIIGVLARNREVEKIVENITRSSVSRSHPHLQDLTQMVYLALLKYEDGRIERMFERGELSFFIARIVINMYETDRSTWYNLFHKYQKEWVELDNPDTNLDI